VKGYEDSNAMHPPSGVLQKNCNKGCYCRKTAIKCAACSFVLLSLPPVVRLYSVPCIVRNGPPALFIPSLLSREIFYHLSTVNTSRMDFFSTTYRVNYSAHLFLLFETTALVFGTIAQTKKLKGLKEKMFNHIDVTVFVDSWTLVENEDDPTKGLPPGKESFIKVTEKQITEFLKTATFVDKALCGPHFIMIRDELGLLEQIPDHLPLEVEGEKIDYSFENTSAVFSHTLAVYLRLAKIRWRSNQKFLNSIHKIETLTL
jgi:hypothetical protein